MNLTNPDVVVIGSGAGGGMAAKVLAEGGLKVLLLEKGDNNYQGLENQSGIGGNHNGNDELKFFVRNFIDMDSRIEPRTFRRSPLRQASVAKVNTLATTVGGGTIHYDGNSPRCTQKDFRTKSIYGPLAGANIEDWPLDYDELEPFYDLAEKTVGLQGESGVNPFEEPRSNPYPMKYGYQKYHSLLLADAARKLGYHPYPTPIAINSAPYRGRPACANCGFCGSHGCAINAKGSTAVTAIRDALLSGNCELRPNCFVYRLNTNAAGTAVESVDYLDARGRTVNQPGGAFILAGNAIESARLCLLSPSGEHPAGLGNSSGFVGRHLMFHSVYSIFGLFPQKIHAYRGRVGTMGMDDFCGSPDPDDPNKLFGGGVVEFGAQLHPIGAANYLPLTGDLHKKYMRLNPFMNHMAVVTFIGEDPPVPTNMIDLDPNVKDVYGFPVSRITYEQHPNDVKVASRYIPKLKRVLGEAGSVFTLAVSLAVSNGGIPDTKHILGTLRMGQDPAKSVTDPYGRFHDLDNLYCADGGVYVTSTSYNPTITIQALAYRQAAHILES